jgi:hypothetical protein
MAIRYAGDLTDPERAALREIISKNKAKRSTIINAYILLKVDRTCGWTNADIASAYTYCMSRRNFLGGKQLRVG